MTGSSAGIESAAAEVEDSMLVDLPTGLSVPVDDSRQVDADPCSSVDERRNAHGVAYRSFELAHRANSDTLGPVVIGKTEAERTMCSTMHPWHLTVYGQNGLSEARFPCTLTLTVGVNEV